MCSSVTLYYILLLLSRKRKYITLESFTEYLSENGIKSSSDLAAFVCSFIEDPGIFFDLTEQERSQYEKQIDQALSLFKDKPMEVSKV